MKKVLIYQNKKSDAYVWDVSTPELLDKAYWSLFKVLDEDWEVYGELQDDVWDRNIVNTSKGDWEHLKILYNKAKTGDLSNIKALLESRKSYEYEEWHITTVKE